MKKSMLLFSGQGSQYSNMSVDLIEKYSYLKDYVNITNKIINKNILDVLKDEDKISNIENSQICIFFASALVIVVLEKEFNLNIEDFTFVAGHSVGEYSALFASKAISFEDGLEILKIRSECMSSNQTQQSLGMLSVLGEDLNIKIKNCINNLNNEYRKNIFIANFNSDSQIVISGEIKALNAFKEKSNEFGIKKTIPLNVNNAFHSPFMDEASLKFERKITNFKIKEPKIPIIMNYTSKETKNTDEIKLNLIKNINNQVKWHDSINYAYFNDVKRYIQIGCKQILVNMIKRVTDYKDIEIEFINSIENLKEI